MTEIKCEINDIKKDLIFVRKIFGKVLEIVPSFNILDKKIVPYGLKPHTRSVSWLVEQVVTQQAKYNAAKIGLKDVNIDLPDTCLHDCVLLTRGNKKYFVNIKITQSKNYRSKNDIAAVEKLYMQYTVDASYRVFYVVLGFNFDNTTINFNKDYTHSFSPQFLPIYVNPRNDKIQAIYQSEPIYRTREDFLMLLQKNSTSIVLQ